MAIYRSVYLSFWEDSKIADSFTPEDKLFMLYCLTNSHTNIIGCYEISIKQIAYEIGYSKEAIELLLTRFITIHKNIDYDYDTRELFVKNWYKYNWTSSEKLEKNVISNISKIKSKKFKEELIDIYNSRDTLSIPYIDTMDTTDTITNTINYNDIIKEIIDYLNMKTKKNYRNNNKETIKHIKARLNENYTIEDFKKVIDNQCEKWMNTNMEDYLRPQTLFGTKFESYLNTNPNTNNYNKNPQKTTYELPEFE